MIRKILKSRIFFLVLGFVISNIVIVSALNVVSDDVTYDNTQSGSSATTVKDAIDDLYVKVSSSTSGGASVYYLGTGTSFNIKSRFPDIYSTLTADNFIIGTNGAPSASTSYYSDNVYHATSSAYTGFGLSKSYNSSTGVLSIGGYSYTLRTCIDSSATYCNDARTSGNATVFAYLVVGTIE